MQVSLHQGALDQFDEQQVGYRHRDQEEKVQSWQRCEAQRPGKRRVWQQNAYGYDQEDRDPERATGATAQGIARSANDKHDQRLRAERLHEPACMEEHRPGVEDTQHEKERQEVEDRTEWPDEDHKVAGDARRIFTAALVTTSIHSKHTTSA